MSDENGKQPSHRSRDLYRAALALLELAACSKPQSGPDGRIQAPAITPLPGALALRLAYCRNSLNRIRETIDEEQKAVRVRHDVEEKKDLKTPEAIAAWTEHAQAAEKELREMMEGEREWSPPATIRVGQLLDRNLPDDWLAALLTVGVIVGELPPDEAPDKKK